MGEFEGTLTLDGAAVKAEAKVIADEDHKYRIVLLSPAGDAKAKRIELDGTGKEGTVSVTRRLVGQGHQRLAAARLQGGRQGRNEAHRAEEPHAGTKAARRGHRPLAVRGRQAHEPGPLEQQAMGLPGRRQHPDPLGRHEDDRDFGSYKLHVEFRVPFMPAARGQGRGNSGVYQHGRYEIQVLDSFGLTENPGECGAIYGQKAADVNVSLPPGQWQTYDIDFTAPQFDASGKQVKGAIITVLHNGVKIHDAVEVKSVTGGAWGQPAKTGPVRLQDHGNPTRFRNIWIVPCDSAKAAAK